MHTLYDKYDAEWTSPRQPFSEPSKPSLLVAELQPSTAGAPTNKLVARRIQQDPRSQRRVLALLPFRIPMEILGRKLSRSGLGTPAHSINAGDEFIRMAPCGSYPMVSVSPNASGVRTHPVSHHDVPNIACNKHSAYRVFVRRGPKSSI